MEMEQFIDKYVKSKDMKEHLRAIEHCFNLQEQATIIQNSDYPISVKHNDLAEILGVAIYLELKTQIKQRIDYDVDAIRIFKENKEGFIYALISHEYDEEDYICGYYGNFELAFRVGLRRALAFRIEKYQVIYENTEIILSREISSPIIEPDINKQVGIDAYYEGNPVSSIFFNINGEVLYYNSNELPIERMRVVESLSNKRFENMYVTIPNPFTEGMKVKVLGNRQRQGIVAMNQDFWQMRDRKAEGENAIEDYSDAGIIIDITDESDYKLHLHVNPLYLEITN